MDIFDYIAQLELEKQNNSSLRLEVSKLKKIISDLEKKLEDEKNRNLKKRI